MLELRGVAKDVLINGQARRVLDAVDMQIHRGEFICIVGARTRGEQM